MNNNPVWRKHTQLQQKHNKGFESQTPRLRIPLTSDHSQSTANLKAAAVILLTQIHKLTHGVSQLVLKGFITTPLWATS